MKYHIITYGCQMNKSDSERIAKILEKKGFKPAPKPMGADLVVVNICSVRQKSVDRAINKIKNVKSKVIATGCILEKDRKKLLKLGVEIKKFNDIEKIKPVTGLVPIMRGCNNFCTYCVVPYTRGREKFRSQKTIIDEIKFLIKKGVREITLLGQNVNSYPNFVKLLQKITALPDDFKITFITNHPKDFSDNLIAEMARNDKIIKYVHLPFQSGDNTILKKMNRHYTRQDYLKLIAKIKKAMSDVEITTDIIVGFPGETKKQFQKTIEVMKAVGFKQAYIAKYSPRPGTAAFKLKDNISLEEKKHREQILLSLIKKQRLELARLVPNQELPKLVVILGPTAAGKTSLSIKLAKKFKGEVVSADSRQVYKEMDIGTGKITKKEMAGIAHYLLDVISPKTKFSVSQYQKKAFEAIDKITDKGKLPFLVGGSPFYIYSVVEGWQFPEMKNNQKLRKELEKQTVAQLFEILKKIDPARAQTIESKNKRRLVRAIEIAKTLGKVPKLKKNPRYDCLILGINPVKEKLEEKIYQRVDKMVQLGLEKEARHLPKTDTIGYQEWQDYFNGQLRKQTVINLIKLHTVQFAKRQMTWFKRDKNIHWITSASQAEKLVKNFIKKQVD